MWWTRECPLFAARGVVGPGKGRRVSVCLTVDGVGIDTEGLGNRSCDVSTSVGAGEGESEDEEKGRRFAGPGWRRGKNERRGFGIR